MLSPGGTPERTHSPLEGASAHIFVPIGAIDQGFPTRGPGTATGSWPIRNRAAQQQVSGGQAGELAKFHLHLQPLSIAGISD